MKRQNEYKLDQETWLCRTHLDDFLVKNLVYFIPYKTQVKSGYKGIPINLWSIFNRPGVAGAVL